jgi:hypothetical protein
LHGVHPKVYLQLKQGLQAITPATPCHRSHKGRAPHLVNKGRSLLKRKQEEWQPNHCQQNENPAHHIRRGLSYQVEAK